MADPLPRLRRVWKRVLRRLHRRYPQVPLPGLKVGLASEFPQPRDMAYSAQARRGGPVTVVVAPRFARQSVATMEGVLMHEIGHVLAFHTGHYGHTERDADHLAESVFGVRIGYDRRRVQTTKGGSRPRPKSLPA